MVDLAVAQEVQQLGVESVAGVPVLATRLLSSASIDLDTEMEFDTIRSTGQEGAGGSALRQEWTSGGLSGVPTYVELAYFLSSRLGAAVITDLGDTPNAYRWVWTRTGLTFPTPKTFTFQRGAVGGGEADQAAHLVVNGLTLDFSRTDEQSIGGSVLARRMEVTGQYLSANAKYTLTANATPPTAGSFTLTKGADTTAAIAWNATAAAVQAALEAIASVGAGNVIVTRTTGTTTLAQANAVYTIEFIGALAQQAVTLTGTFTGLTASGSIALASAQAGAAPTQLENVPILAGQGDVYLDTTGAAIGTTKLTRDFTVSIDFGEGFEPFWPINSALTSFGGLAPTVPEPTITLQLGNDATARALYASIRAATKQFIRYRAVGATISGANAYRFTADVCGSFNGPPARGEAGALSVLDIPFLMTMDGTWAGGQMASYELITSISGL